MNKSELINKMAEELHLQPRQAGDVIHTILEAMSKTLEEDGNIEIRGFGSFTVKTYKPYTGRNPKSGEKISVQPKKLPFFKVGKELKERVDS